MARTTRPWSAPSSPTGLAPPCARWPRRWASRWRRLTGWPRRSTPAMPATWPATWRWTAASAGCSTRSAWTWRRRRSRRTVTDAGPMVARSSRASPIPPGTTVLARCWHRLRCRSAPTWPMPRHGPGMHRATTMGGRTASPAGCRRDGRACSTSRWYRSSTKGGSRSATGPAACAWIRRRRSCQRGSWRFPSRATTARPVPPAIAPPWCGWTRSPACRSRNDAARASCREPCNPRIPARDSPPECLARFWGRKSGQI